MKSIIYSDYLNSFFASTVNTISGLTNIQDTDERQAQIEPASASPQTLLLSVKIPPTIATIPTVVGIQKTKGASTSVKPCVAKDWNSTVGTARRIKIPATVSFQVFVMVDSINSLHSFIVGQSLLLKVWFINWTNLSGNLIRC